ncbi:MAG: hypothetical protein E7359_02820 [Clostridiales bacterium]|nr:hypothetical protein [Clostridiales bacterium]
MVWLWVTVAVVVVLGIGISTNLILKQSIKKNEQSILENSTNDQSCETIAEQIDSKLDEKFNDQNKKLKDVKINIYPNETKNKKLKSNAIEDENILVK